MYGFRAAAQAELPVAEVERIKQVVLATFPDNGDPKAFSDAREAAFEKASSGQAYEVFEWALNSTNPSSRNAAVRFLMKARIPEVKKRALLIYALQNPSIWPERFVTRNARLAMAVEDFQFWFCKALSEAFHTTVDPTEFEEAWREPAFRMALAKRLGGATKVPAEVGPDEASRVWPPKVGEATSPAREGSKPIFSLANPGAPTSERALPGGWPLWSGIAALLAVAGGWLLLRSKGKNG